jgi:GT2 family glycosyltransferase
VVKQDSRVLFVVLNFNGWVETLKCVDAILDQTYPDFHIMLIDNGSHDDSLKKLVRFENNKKITYIKQSVNLGFAGGVNVGIRYAIEQKFAYVALLNNDAIITKDWMGTLVGSIKKQGTSSVTGLLLSGDGKRIESTGDSYSRWGLPFPLQRDEPVSKANDSGLVFGGTAGASLYKTSLFEDIGLFDEAFFAYFEDTDISYRAQLAGHTSYYEKTALAYHDHGTTSRKIPGFTVHQTFQNLPVFFWKDTPAYWLFPNGVRFFACYALMYVRAVLRGQFKVATKGLLKSISLFPHALRERHIIQKKRRVSIEYLRTVIYPDLPPNNKGYARRIFHR